MREAGLLVLDKLERRLRLSASEQAALANARQACRADVSYYRVKAAIRGRDARTARAAVSELLRLRWTVKFAVLAFALRWAPRLTMSLADRRDH
jgi:hypothetical protein